MWTTTVKCRFQVPCRLYPDILATTGFWWLPCMHMTKWKHAITFQRKRRFANPKKQLAKLDIVNLTNNLVAFHKLLFILEPDWAKAFVSVKYTGVMCHEQRSILKRLPWCEDEVSNCPSVQHWCRRIISYANCIYKVLLNCLFWTYIQKYY